VEIEIENLNRLGGALLAELADDANEDCARQFDALFYEPVWKFARAHHDRFSSRVARYLGLDEAVAPEVLPDEVDEVAHDATALALRRVRENAGRFDPNRGQLFQWLIGAVEYAYIEVAKTVVAARRSDRLQFRAPEDVPDIPSSAPTTEELVLQQIRDAETFASAASHVSEKEFVALRLVVTLGYSYAEAAQCIFGDPEMTRQVDGLLTRGKKKLAAAWEGRRSSPQSAGSSNFSGSMRETEGTDG
jgi:DNA-directed RNA polymerase specialized sigma24 family protein